MLYHCKRTSNLTPQLQVNVHYFSITAWKGGGLPHLLGVSHLSVNKPLRYLLSFLSRLQQFVCVVTIDSPINVQFSASKSVVCENETIIFKCSSHGNPAVDGYELFENDTLVNSVSSSGVWKRKMLRWGMFVYRCVVKNAIGTGRSTKVVVNVNCE